VEKLAREKLQMRLVLPAITTYVGYTEPSQGGKSVSGSVQAMPQVSASAGARP
jgi:hypothetical protein